MTDGQGSPVGGSPPAGEPRPGPSPDGLRALALRGAFGAGLGAVAVVVALGAWIFPYYRDDRVLDKVVREVAMDWRDFGEARARARLEYELDRARIGMWVPDDACTLVDDGAARRVQCVWRVALTLPGTQRRLPMAFRSSASVGHDGVLGP